MLTDMLYISAITRGPAALRDAIFVLVCTKLRAYNGLVFMFF